MTKNDYGFKNGDTYAIKTKQEIKKTIKRV